jgi:outer membrane protein assembly factor BamB
MAAISLCLVAMVLCLAGCGERPERPLDAFFVRQGLVVQAHDLTKLSVARDGKVMAAWDAEAPGAGAVRLDAHRLWLNLDWQPGEEWRLEVAGRQGKQRLSLTAPQRPSPLLVSRTNLEYVLPSRPAMGSNPDTEVRFSPDGSRLAIGSIRGWLRVVETMTGRVVYAKKMAEGMVKRIAWGRHGDREVLYVGEQSPDGFIYCLDAADGGEIWRYRTADDVDTSTATADDTHNRVYNLPGLYQLLAFPGEELVAVSTHGWYRDEKWATKCLVYGISGLDGRIKWRWPRDKVFPHSITWFAASADGGTLAFSTFRASATMGADPDFPGGALYCLDGKRGVLSWLYRVPPLMPYYRRPSCWMGVAVSPHGERICLGLNDGRAMLFSSRYQGRPAPLWTKEVGTPVMVGDIPVAAPISYAAMDDRIAYLALPNTVIPASTGNQRSRLPTPHPMSNYLLAVDLGGDILWRWRSPGATQGMFLSRDGRWAATGITADRGSRDTNLFGLALFDTTRPGSGAAKLLYHYACEGPLFFQADFSADGRFLAVTEYPYSLDEGKTVYGRYRVQVIH